MPPAAARASSVGGDRVCTTDSRYGTYCRSTRPRNEWEAQEQERRNQRQLERLYAVCMRDRGWQSNTDGVGYASGTKG